MANVTAVSIINSTNTARHLELDEAIGPMLLAESALISLIAVLAVFVLLIRNAFRNGYVIKRPADLYMISLFAFNLIMAVGRVFDIGGCIMVELKRAFTARPKQFGELGSSLATLAIAIHIFVVVIWGKLGDNFIIAYCIVAFDWLFVVLFVALSISHVDVSSGSIKQHGYYETPDPFWCWINPAHEAEQIAGEYGWLWLTMLVSLITYTLIFLWARGNLTVSSTRWWDIRVHHAFGGSNGYQWQQGPICADDRVSKASPLPVSDLTLSSSSYPIVFTVLVLPLSIVRFKYFGKAAATVPPAATFVVQCLYSLSGALNVTLFLTTRSGLLLPKPTPAISTALLHSGAESDAENGLGQLRGSVAIEGGSLSLRHPHSTYMRSVERGERPIALTALPGATDEPEDW
ncbi:hypothetical protein FIBSPDRAFT_1051795 [Athelia psychrophila]|uniref:Glucose receptor Git3 N-terminal domain-containing protein n=1 Tax=Athelia psychrophila TaxID=1759441 RepID=A0A165YF94_9AGAM|nr:hypothetical protein FIBSPDRAFT_1051795 [Fibularhizoctonia sp. CBS 109695]